MIYIAFTDSKVFLKSDTSTKEMNEFIGGTGVYAARVNGGGYGVHYTMPHSERNNKDKLIAKFELPKIKYKIVPYNQWWRKATAIMKSVPPTSEKAIRDAVVEYLKKNHNIVYLQSEYTHSNLNVRTDLFATTSDRKIISVEVKSDRDTLARLEKQLRAYLTFSHIVYIATDIKHFEKVERMVRDRKGLSVVGMLVYENGELTEQSGYYAGMEIDATNILWKQEFQRMLSPFSFKGRKSCSSPYLEKLAKNIFTVTEYQKICEHLFVDRYLGQDTDGATLRSLYRDHEYKQSLIERIVE